MIQPIETIYLFCSCKKMTACFFGSRITQKCSDHFCVIIPKMDIKCEYRNMRFTPFKISNAEICYNNILKINYNT